MARKTVSDRKDEFIRELADARRGILELAREIPPQRLDEPFLGVWSIKDLLAHLIGWDFTNLQAIQEILDGTVPTFFRYYDKDWHSYNAGLVEKYKKEPFEALLAELNDSHHQLVTFLQALPPNDLVKGKARSEKGRTVTIRNLLQSESKDESDHAGQVRAYFRQPD